MSESLTGINQIIANAHRREVAAEIEWFESLLESLEAGEIEIAKEAVRGAIAVKQREIE